MTDWNIPNQYLDQTCKVERLEAEVERLTTEVERKDDAIRAIFENGDFQPAKEIYAASTRREHVCTPDIWNEATEQHLCSTCGKRV